MDSTILQYMMAVGLAVCAGLRAWTPLFAVGLLARLGYLPLSHNYGFLTTDGALVGLGLLAVVEILGDKALGVDHLMDVVGTVVRPVSGAVVASAVLSHTDPTIATFVGIFLGGGAALTVHTGKAALRVKSTALAPLHIGAGNAAISTTEDLITVGGLWLATNHPVAAFVLALCLLALSLLLIFLTIHTGRKIASLFTRRRPASSGTVR